MESIQQLAAQADAALKQVSTADVAAVAGGTTSAEVCSTTLDINAGVVAVHESAPNLAAAIIDVYEGIVQSTSYIIERVLTPFNSEP